MQQKTTFILKKSFGCILIVIPAYLVWLTSGLIIFPTNDSLNWAICDCNRILVNGAPLLFYFRGAFFLNPTRSKVPYKARHFRWAIYPPQEKNCRSVHLTSAKNDLSHIHVQSLKSFHCRPARRGEMVFLFERSAVSRYRLVWACEHASQAVIWPWASHVTQSWVWAEGDRCSAHDSFDATAAAAMWVVVFGFFFWRLEKVGLGFPPYGNK